MGKYGRIRFLFEFDKIKQCLHSGQLTGKEAAS
jgi:hypothetical protein